MAGIRRPDEYRHNNNNLAIVDSINVRGGLKMANNQAQMLAFPQDKLHQGTFCYRIDVSGFFYLTGTPANANNIASWTQLSLSAAVGSLVYRGTLDASGAASQIANAQVGYFYLIDTAGTFLGTQFDVGDHLVVNTNITGTPTDNSSFDKIDNSDQDNIKRTNIGPGLIYDNTEDHLTLDLTALPLLTPSLMVTWVLTLNGGGSYTLKSGTTTSNNIIVDRGVNANFTGAYRYVPGTGFKNPTGVTGSWNTVQPNLPNANTFSANLVSNAISANTTFTVGFSAAKSGLVVSNNQVQFPTGNDTTSNNASINYRDEIYAGQSTSATLAANQFRTLANNRLSTTQQNWLLNNITTSGTEYFYIAYPSDWGDLSGVELDGSSPILGAFTKQGDISFTNDGGLSLTYAVWRSNALGAFTSNTIEFQF